MKIKFFMKLILLVAETLTCKKYIIMIIKMSYWFTMYKTVICSSLKLWGSMYVHDLSKIQLQDIPFLLLTGSVAAGQNDCSRLHSVCYTRGPGT